MGWLVVLRWLGFDWLGWWVGLVDLVVVLCWLVWVGLVYLVWLVGLGLVGCVGFVLLDWLGCLGLG